MSKTKGSNKQSLSSILSKMGYKGYAKVRIVRLANTSGIGVLVPHTPNRMKRVVTQAETKKLLNLYKKDQEKKVKELTEEITNVDGFLEKLADFFK